MRPRFGILLGIAVGSALTLFMVVSTGRLLAQPSPRAVVTAEPLPALPPQPSGPADLLPPRDPEPAGLTQAPQPSPTNDDPEKAAGEFVEKTRREAEASVKALHDESKALRERLKKVEAALNRFEALLSALDPDRPRRVSANGRSRPVPPPAVASAPEGDLLEPIPADAPRPRTSVKVEGEASDVPQKTDSPLPPLPR